MKNRTLTFTEAVMLVAGAGIGTGILTLPYAIGKLGVFGTLIACAAAYVVSILLYFMIADLALHSRQPAQLLGILQEHLFTGKHGQILSSVFFVILVLLLLENLIVYILCAADVLTSLLGLHAVLAKIIFYLLASLVILFGIKGIGVGEKYSVFLIGGAVVVLTGLSLFNIKNGFSFTFGEPKLIFAVYGLFMFAFSAIFSVIQVCGYIDKPENTKKAIFGGLTLNALLTLIFAAAVILGSKEITEVATVGLADSLGIPFVKIICALLVLLAMLSSYWSSGLAFADAIRAQFNLSEKNGWLIGTLPTVLLAVLLPLTVLNYMQIGAGALSIVLIVVVLPAYRNAVRHSEKTLLPGRFGKSKLLLWIVGAMLFLMAASSLIPIS